MKFILLKKPNICPFDLIRRLGCGPNFVANRRDAFELMVKEQGLLFWFRFWFVVCNHPTWDIVIWIKENWPVLCANAELTIHRHLFKGSHEDAAQFCLNAIDLLRNPEPIHKKKFDTGANTTFKELIKQCVMMAFAAAMCVLFHKWLNTSEVYDECKAYWITPEKYLDQMYKPEILEKLLVKEWDDNLLQLLGIHLDNLVQVSWLLEMLYQPDGKEYEEEENIYPWFAFNTKKTLITSIDQCRMLIDEADELLCERPSFPLPKIVSNHKRRVLPYRHNKSHFRLYCAYCKCFEDTHRVLKYCKRCLVENCRNPKRYCSVTCQLEHWFVEHCKDHQLK